MSEEKVLKDMEEIAAEEETAAVPEKEAETPEAALAEEPEKAAEAPAEASEAADGAPQAVEEAAEAAPETPAELPEEPAESMDDYKDALEASFRQIHVGDILEGRVISVDETGVLLDLDYYAPGKIPAEEMSDDPHFSLMESVSVGDRMSATVTKRDDGAGNILLSRKQADDVLAWDRLKKLQADGTVITGKIQEVVKAGAILYVEGVRGFIPASKLALTYVEDTKEYLGKTVEVQVADVDEEQDKLVLSAKELLTAKAVEEKNRKISRLQAGNIVEGRIESLKDYGAFVDIGDGITGLLHISQIREARVNNIRSVLKEGQTVRVLITKVDNGKISLSMKALEDALNTEKADKPAEEYSDGGQASTSLYDLLKGFKL